jgi:ubiquinone/menaquinone biosynthesis C-methylase UbiE
MATDIEAIIRNIEPCYDFTGKSVIHVGAGGGQFVGYAGRTRKVLGVDPDPGAVERLKQVIREKGLESRFSALQGDILTVTARADVVFFEFCLHEIADPRAALRHARTLAPETLVVDPAPGSTWAWYLCEAEKVQRGWAAAEESRLALDRRFEGVQRFHDHAELLAKVQVLGESVIRRIEEFRDRRDFTIDMPYRVALLAG